MASIKNQLDQSFMCKVDGKMETWISHEVKTNIDPEKVEPQSALKWPLWVTPEPEKPKEEVVPQTVISDKKVRVSRRGTH